VELLIGSSLAAVIMTAVLSSFLFMGRNLTRVASYQALENEARKGLAWMRQDFSIAMAVKSGTMPSASTVTLVLPSGEVTYTYDSTNLRLRRQANFGANRDFNLLQSSQCNCTSFTLEYFTTLDAAPTDQTSGANVPYSIKQIQVGFGLESPAAWSSQARTRFDAASARFFIRNRSAPDGT
jgi:hypothetical protein